MKSSLNACHVCRFVLMLLLLAAQLRAELSGQQKALAIEAARNDLYAQLVRQIKGIQVSDKTLVANMVVEDSTKIGSVQGFVRGARLSDPQFVGDICLIQGSITLQQVVENVNEMTRSVGGVAISQTKVETLNAVRVIRAQGTGSVVSPSPGARVSDVGTPDDGLVQVIGRLSGSGQTKLGAIEAAKIDALAQLARQVKGVRISDSALVFNMATESRWTESDMTALVQGAVVVRYSVVDPELVACTMQITLQQVVENIDRSAQTKKVPGLESVAVRSVSEQIQLFNPTMTVITSTGYGAIRGSGSPVSSTGAEMVGAVK